MYIKSVKILGKIKRKPDHFYYIDRNGDLWEAKGFKNKTTLWERIQIKWIDWFYRHG